MSVHATRPDNRLVSISAACLQTGKQALATIACTSANTDFNTAIPATARYVAITPDNPVTVSVGQETSSTVGVYLPGNVHVVYPIRTEAGDGLFHVQSPVAGAVVKVSFLED